MTALPTPPMPAPAPAPALPDDTPALTSAAPRDQAEGTTWSVVTPISGRADSDAPVRVVLVEELSRVASHLSELLAPDQRVRLVDTVTEGRVAVERITSERPDVVIVDALLQGQLSGLDVVRALRAAGSDMPVFFLTVPEQPVALTAELGTAGVLTLPIDRHTLLTSIIEVHQVRRREAAAPSGTVAVFSAKGGVGRTAIAHNLAVAMNGTSSARTVLIDGDQVHGDLRLHLEAPEDAPSLVQLPTGHVSDDDIRSLLWQDATGLDVLLAPPRMEQADLIMLADTRTARTRLRQLFDLVVIDVPTVMDDMTLAVLDDADVVLDVTTPRHGAVRKTQRCHAVLHAADFPMDKVLTVVNHADPGYDPAEFSAELGWSPDAVLMHDERLATGSVAAGSSIVTAYPDSLFSRGFAELAELLALRLKSAPAQLAARAA